MNKRILNLVLCVVSLALLLAFPVRSLLFSELPDNARGEGAAMASYVMLFLFGALSLVFAIRTIKGDTSRRSEQSTK